MPGAPSLPLNTKLTSSNITSSALQGEGAGGMYAPFGEHSQVSSEIMEKLEKIEAQIAGRSQKKSGMGSLPFFTFTLPGSSSRPKVDAPTLGSTITSKGAGSLDQAREESQEESKLSLLEKSLFEIHYNSMGIKKLELQLEGQSQHMEQKLEGIEIQLNGQSQLMEQKLEGIEIQLAPPNHGCCACPCVIS